MSSDAHRPVAGRVEFPNAPCIPCPFVPNVKWDRGFQGIFTRLTRRASILPVLVGIDSRVVEELAGPGVDSPPLSVGNRDRLNKDEVADIPGVAAVIISIENLKRFFSRIAL